MAGSSAFGCSEIPVSDAEKASLAPKAVLQLPLVLGAMSVFHSIPAAHTGTAGLELSPCMLAKIFSRTVTDWNDPALREGGVNIGLASVSDRRAPRSPPAHAPSTLPVPRKQAQL